jgi:hypothetical protein
MPRTIDPLLRQMYERANPNVCEFVEIAQPDVGQVLAPLGRPVLDESAARLGDTSGTTQQSPGGGLMLKATTAQIASIYTADRDEYPAVGAGPIEDSPRRRVEARSGS